MEPQANKPPSPSSVDLIIHKHHGSSFALDLMPETIQASKTDPTPSLTQMIEELTRKNGRLKEQLAGCHELQEHWDGLRCEVDFVINRLKIAVLAFRKAQLELGGNLIEACNELKESNST